MKGELVFGVGQIVDHVTAEQLSWGGAASLHPERWAMLPRDSEFASLVRSEIELAPAPPDVIVGIEDGLYSVHTFVLM